MLVLEFKAKGNQTQYTAIDDAIRTGQFVRNKCIRYKSANHQLPWLQRKSPSFHPFIHAEGVFSVVLYENFISLFGFPLAVIVHAVLKCPRGDLSKIKHLPNFRTIVVGD